MSRRVVGALASLALLAGASCAPSEPAPADPRSAGSRRMAERLAGLTLVPDPEAAALRGFDAFSVNRPDRIPDLRRQIESVTDPFRGLELRWELATELLLDGSSVEALQIAEELESMAARIGMDRDRKRFAALQALVGLAAMRVGEQQNCIGHHAAQSCIFPIRGAGTHQVRAGSERAAQAFARQLELDPSALDARWLLNLAHMTLGSHPDGVPRRWLIPEDRFRSAHDPGPFVDVAPAAGVAADGLAGGSAMEDFDGDGLLDLVASSWGLGDQLRYFRNEGDGSFSDRTNAAGLLGQVGGLNLNHADYDNDGDADILVLRGGWLGEGGRHPNSLLRNRGDGTFDDVTEQAGLLSFHPSMTAAWGDYDGDGWLDLFVGSEQLDPDRPHPSELFHNNGDGTFTNVAEAVGLADLGFVKGSAWGDYDNDGRPDLYVSRLGRPNLLFRNGGPGAAAAPWVFVESAGPAGVQEPRLSFPTWFLDYDNDGWLDLFVATWDGSPVSTVAGHYLGIDLGAETPRLFRNRGDGTFEDVSASAGVGHVLLTMGANFGDLDNDGWLDLYLGTGAPDLATLMPNHMLRNDGGRGFQDVTTAVRLGHLQKGHGISFGDIDNDGDQDIHAVMGGWFTGDAYPDALFLNPGHGHAWVTLRLVGERSNRSGVGARIRVVVETPAGPRTVHSGVSTGGSFGSSSLQAEIGLGDAQRIVRIEIDWPSGERQRHDEPPMNRFLVAQERTGRLVVEDRRQVAASALP